MKELWDRRRAGRTVLLRAAVRRGRERDPMTDFLPRRDADVLRWAINFDRLVHASPELYNQEPATAAEFRALLGAYDEAYRRAAQPGTCSRSDVADKEDAKSQMILLARAMAARARASLQVSNAQRLDLGLRPRSAGRLRRIAPPTTAPLMTLAQVVGSNTLRVRLIDAAAPARVAKPRGVGGALLFTYVGEGAAPPPFDGWTRAVQTGRTTVDLKFPVTLPAGTQVHVLAYWLSPTVELGPPSAPVAARLIGGWGPALVA